jgi:hypothetical protein
MRSWNPVDLNVPKDVYISGSSFATPIVAGIAANVLEFSRHKLNLNQTRKDILYSHLGMTKILKAMSSRRGDYDFLHPLRFWEEKTRNDPENICRVLNSFLDFQ